MRPLVIRRRVNEPAVYEAAGSGFVDAALVSPTVLQDAAPAAPAALESDAPAGLVAPAITAPIDWHRTIGRYAIYAVGLAAISLGTVLQTESGLGVASLTCFAAFAARALGTTLGIMIVLTYAAYVAVQSLLMRHEFSVRILLEMVFAFCMGEFVDAIAVLVRVSPQGIVAQLSCMCAALVVTAFGVTLMVGMEVVPNAPDGLVQAIARTLGTRFGNVKVVFDVSHVLASVAGSLLVFGDISGFGVTTVVSALFLGRIINVFDHFVGTPVHRLVFGAEDAEDERGAKSAEGEKGAEGAEPR